MYFQQVRTPGLGCFSYTIGCPLVGGMVVVDPRRDIEVYLDMARQNNMRIIHIFDTHVHADHISGAQELQKATGAPIHIHENAEVGYKAEKVKEGDTFVVGSARLQILHTPGHTPNSIAILVTDTARSQEPEMVLTGDALFVGDAGRPDLPGHEIMDKQVQELYDSLYKKLGALPDGVEVYPAHGQGSLCGRNMSAKGSSTLGYERKANPMLLCKDFAEFKKKILSNMPMRPQSFSYIIKTNIDGAPLLERSYFKEYGLNITELEKAVAEGASVVDTRDVVSFAGAHIPSSLNVETEDAQISNWLGTIRDPQTKIVLILRTDTDFTKIATEMHRIGYDQILGYLKGGIRSWISAGKDFNSLPLITAAELKKQLTQTEPPTLVDVRSPAEWESFHIQNSIHLPIDILSAEENSCFGFPTNDVVVICQSGYRSNMAASLFLASKCNNIHVLAGGLQAWHAHNKK